MRRVGLSSRGTGHAYRERTILTALSCAAFIWRNPYRVFSYFNFLGVLWVRRSHVRLSFFFPRKRPQNYWLGFWWRRGKNRLRTSRFYSFRLWDMNWQIYRVFLFLLPRVHVGDLILFFDVNHLFFSPFLFFLWLVLACAYIITPFSRVSLSLWVLISFYFCCVSLLVIFVSFLLWNVYSFIEEGRRGGGETGVVRGSRWIELWIKSNMAYLVQTRVLCS